jgi:hypothetical protein
MRLGQDVLSDLPRALAHEWLLGNGLGGASLGDAALALGRRAHALLVTPGNSGAHVALLAFDERLHVGDQAFDLSTRTLAGGAVRPAGHARLESFTLDPWPVWRWQAGGVTLERSLFLIEDHHALVVSWRQVDGPPARLVVAPVLVARDPDGCQREDPAFLGVVKGQPGRVRIVTTEDRPALTLWHNGAFLPARLWLTGIDHPLDPPAADPPRAARGKPRGRPRANADAAGEDAFVAGYVEARLSPGSALHVASGTEDDLFKALAREGRLGTPPPHTLGGCVEVLAAAERERAARLLAAAQQGADLTARQAITAHGAADVPDRRGTALDPADPWVARAARAFDAALVRRAHRVTVLATLPGGIETGTGALRAVPGLASLRMFDAAAAVVRGAIEYLNEGFVPERFDAEGYPHYGDPEPSLWLVHAGDVLARRQGDAAAVRDQIYPMLESIMQAFRAGTRGGVRVDTDGLLSVGEAEGAVKPATLNVLWYHALVAMAQLARLVGRRENSAFYLAWARDHQHRFVDALWDDQAGLLHEALGPGGPRPGARPGHLLAAALSPAILPVDRAARLVGNLEAALFTPAGLRPEPGAREARPEWLGTFFTAYLRVNGRRPEAQARVREWMELFGARIGACGQVPERFVPGEPTDTPACWRAAGAPAAIVPIAELLRVWVEELDPVDAGVAAV